MIEFLEGFESATQTTGGHRFTTSSASGGVGTTYGRNGGRGWSMNNSYIDVPLTAARNSIYCGLAINFTALTSSVPLRIYNGSTVIGRILLNIDGSFAYQRGNGTATMYTSAAGLAAAGVFKFYEFHWVGHLTAGTFEVRVNDIVGGTYSGQTTNSGDPTDGTMLEWTLDGSIDDLYVVSTGGGGIVTYLGDGSLIPIRPTAAGTYATGAQTGGTGGSPWTAVNEVTPDDDTSYLSFASAGNIHSFAHGALGVTVTSIKAMQVIAKTRLSAAGSGQVAGFVRSGSTDSAGAGQGVTSVYAPYATIYENDPATSAAWTASGVNAAEIGVKKIA